MRHWIITFATLGALGPPLAVWAEGAQIGEAFEVASIRFVASPRNFVRFQVVGDTFVAEGVTAAILIRYAYGLKDFQLSGGPDWIRDRESHDAAAYRIRRPAPTCRWTTLPTISPPLS